MNEVSGNAEPQLRNKNVNEWRSRGYLPHRDCFGLLQSITFRLADSLPQEKLRQLDEELLKMKRDAELGLCVPEKNSEGKGHISGLETEKRRRIEAWLDAGMGCCALSHPQMAAVMQDTLLKFDEEKYMLLAWCIMPNHLHVLIEPKVPLSVIVRSWKSFTGRWAMRNAAELGLRVSGGEAALGRCVPVGGEVVLRQCDPGGEDTELRRCIPESVDVRRLHVSRFWMPDYWDRYIRDEKHLRSVVDYIHNNPVKAGLCQKETDWPWSSAYVFHSCNKESI